ncbi:glutamine amidotransferase subunit pdxT [Mycobacterium kansasii]|uniref:Glutamine amidotransferase subunit pdxT n=1 Tax=Mycobacterium kansasii TaxID=1768 RepID=A0A1V3W989_MYCKA|nr:glutamine amidotransferase subunit pdxT [Mycobacterium kansasii]
MRRNALGPSRFFEGDIAFAGLDDRCVRCSFRAPWVERAGEVCRCWPGRGHIVAVRQGAVLATAFHPEITGDRRIHQLFVDIVRVALTSHRGALHVRTIIEPVILQARTRTSLQNYRLGGRKPPGDHHLRST